MTRGASRNVHSRGWKCKLHWFAWNVVPKHVGLDVKSNADILSLKHVREVVRHDQSLLLSGEEGEGNWMREGDVVLCDGSPDSQQMSCATSIIVSSRSAQAAKGAAGVDVG